jgi:predicted nucleic acid-binding protein
VVAVEASLHASALASYREAAASPISFVDRTSFAFMRANRLEVAFAFDADFVNAGFDLAN